MGQSVAKPGSELSPQYPLAELRLRFLRVLLMLSDWLACASPSWINYRFLIAD